MANNSDIKTPWHLWVVGILLLLWQGLSWWIEHPTKSRPSVTVLMSDYRREWMRVMVTREPRIFDAQVMMSLRQGTSFFASTCSLFWAASRDSNILLSAAAPSTIFVNENY